MSRCRATGCIVLLLALGVPPVVDLSTSAANGPSKGAVGTPDCAYSISTVAGNGEPGFAGDGGPATAARLNRPCAVAVDAEGQLYIADYHNARIRKVGHDGVISTLAGSGEAGFGGDGGPATHAKMHGPYGVQVDKDGNVYVADQGNNRIRKISPKGRITTVAGNGRRGFAGDGGPATDASLSGPNDMLIDAAGHLIIADSGNHRLRKVNHSGIISTIAGTGKLRYNGASGLSGDGGPALQARFNHPSTLVQDAAGNLYVGDFNNHAVRKITPDGIVSTVAGTGQWGFNGNGILATHALFNEVGGVALDPHGQLIITDGGNFQVRRVDHQGVIEAIAGTGRRGDGGDGGPALDADLSVLDNVVADAHGNLYITDHRNNRIRKLTPVPPEKPTGSAEQLLEQMRRAYQGVRFARVEFTFRRHLDRDKAQPQGVLLFAAPNRVRADMEFPGFGKITVCCDGGRITTLDSGEKAPDVRDYSARDLYQMVPANLEILCLYDWRKQLSTAPGGNMRGSKLHVIDREKWNDKEWTVLEETTDTLTVRYFIALDSHLIWRTQIKERPSGETRYDGWLTRFEALDTVNDRQFEAPKGH
jgi:sugar lactone lactonase YvrE